MPNYPHTTKKTIPYDSPSGSIHIGKWVPPFKEVAGGFGFVGVVAEDVGTGKMQCHACGNWYEMLATHAAFAHGLQGGAYHDKYGLSRSTALRAIRIRKIQSTVIQKLQREGKMGLGNNLGNSPMVKGNKHAANRAGKPKSIESQNKFGVCDLQVADKIKRLEKRLGRTPALNEVIDEYGGGISTLIHYRYGGYVKLVRSLNMTPLFSNSNPKYSRQYFIEKGVAAINSGQKLIANRLLSESESRNMYHYFKDRQDWEFAVIDEVSKQKTCTI